MTGRLHDMLDELAGDPASVPDPDQLIARDRSRRRRRIAMVAPVVVTAVAVGAGTVVATWPQERPRPPAVRQTPSNPPVVDAKEPIAAGRLPWLPKVVERPDTATPLPGRPVGKGSLVYVGCRGTCGTYLMTTDGAQYQLRGVGSPYQGASLSPDGRWLGLRGEKGYLLRDLSGTTVREFPASRPDEPVGWSADGKWLVIPTDAEGGQLLIDASTGESWPFVDDQPLTGVLPSGQVVASPEGYDPAVGGNSGSYRLPLLDPRTGEKSHLRIDLRGALRPDESLDLVSGWAARSDGEVAAFTVRRTVDPDAGTTVGEDVVLVDLATGKVSHRIDLPTSRLGPVPEDPNDSPPSMDARHVVAYLKQGVLLAHHQISSNHVEFELLDPKTGKRRLVTVLRDSWRYLVRGANPIS
ncbi:MAG: hypothetical protein ACRDUA_04345 [Micromonosporaceae bacterium]